METMARARTHRRLGRGLVEAALGEVAASGFRETLEVLGRAFPLTLCAALAAFGAAAGPAAAADTWYASPGGSDTIMLLRCTRYIAVKPSLKRSYRLTVVVADAAGNRSKPRSIGFRVVRR